MPPKRKRETSRPVTNHGQKRSKSQKSPARKQNNSERVDQLLPVGSGLIDTVDNAPSTGEENSVTNLNIASLTETITKNVTSAVLSNLQALGVLANKIATSTGSAVRTGPPVSIALSESNPMPSQQVNLTEDAVSGTAVDISQGNAASSSFSVPGLNSSDSSSDNATFTAQKAASKSGFVSAALPLHCRVPMKTKEKIWADEYVELSTLQEENVDDVTISVKSGRISTTSSTKRKYMTIEQWTDAFGIFAAVYRLKYPSQSEQLSSYMQVVRKIASERGAWHYYDTNFRKIRVTCNLSWDQIHSELYVTALSRKQTQQTQRFRTSRDLAARERSRYTIPYTCNKYNKGTYCSGCDFRHVCKFSNCGGKHPGYRCYKNGYSRNSGSAGSSDQTGQLPTNSKQLQSQSKSSAIPRPANAGQMGNPK